MPTIVGDTCHPLRRSLVHLSGSDALAAPYGTQCPIVTNVAKVATPRLRTRFRVRVALGSHIVPRCLFFCGRRPQPTGTFSVSVRFTMMSVLPSMSLQTRRPFSVKAPVYASFLRGVSSPSPQGTGQTCSCSFVIVIESLWQSSRSVRRAESPDADPTRADRECNTRKAVGSSSTTDMGSVSSYCRRSSLYASTMRRVEGLRCRASARP